MHRSRSSSSSKSPTELSVSPRPAATVLLLRDGPGGIETFLLRRATTMAFAPRMHVYPGGRVDDCDYAARVTYTASDERIEQLARRASADVRGLSALYACAVREVQEEVGILLAHTDDQGHLQIDPDQMPLVDHWVTPEVERMRYDVRFFVAVVPQDQVAALTTTEADGAFWVRAEEALQARRAGDMAMLPPTEATLGYLTRFTEAEQVVADARTRPVVPLLPRRIVDEDGSVRWAMVHDRTGEVLIERIDRPHTSETDGLSFPEHLQ